MDNGRRCLVDLGGEFFSPERSTKQTRLQLPPVPPAETFLNDHTGIILGRYQADMKQGKPLQAFVDPIGRPN